MVSGDLDRPLTLSRVDIANMPHITCSLTEKGGKLTSYSGVPLSELLRKLNVIKGDHVMGKDLAAYVLVEAKDGYEVVFGLGELDAAVSGRTILLADLMGGKSLDDKVGPLRIVVSGDPKQARCVRMVTELHIVRIRK